MSGSVPPANAGVAYGARLAEVFVLLADSLVDDYDIVELLDRLTGSCVEVVPASAAGILLSDAQGNLRVMATSSERVRLLEVFQLQNDEGPCLDCVRTGQPVSVPNLAEERRWPRFTSVALDAGFTAVQALPMRLRDQTVGALNLLFAGASLPSESALRVGQALADVATISLLQQRALHRQSLLAEQLQHALDSRIVIEQAKGMLSQHWGVDMSHAFSALRRYARDHNLKLSDLAVRLVAGDVHPADVAPVRQV